MPNQRSPLVMGVLNVTPDSFSDGGQYLNLEASLKQADKLVLEGADILDVGGESTRPGSKTVDAETEKSRVIPVIERIRKKYPNVQISIDTSKVEVATAAVKAGATILNDITAAKDIAMAKLAKDNGLTMILMHMQGTPENMQETPTYSNGVLTEVQSFLKSRVRLCKELGIETEKLWVDPGIGFGKTVQHNLDLLRRMDKLEGIGGRVVIGASRKSFISKVCNQEALPIEERLPGTLTSHLYAYTLGASVFRVHDVKEMKRALQMWNAISYGV